MTRKDVIKILFKHADIEDSGNKCYLESTEFSKTAEEIVKLFAIPVVVGQSEQLFCDEHAPKVRYDWQKGKCLTCGKALKAK